jgi:hypothetical protein
VQINEFHAVKLEVITADTNEVKQVDATCTKRGVIGPGAATELHTSSVMV